MPRLRTAVALLFHVLLLHVSVLGGGMACAPTWAGLAGGAATVAAGDAQGAHGHGMHGGAQAERDATAHAPDAAPRPDGAPAHCVTPAGCVVASLVGPPVVDATLLAVRTVAVAAPVALPPSTRAAPETPPPRA